VEKVVIDRAGKYLEVKSTPVNDIIFFILLALSFIILLPKLSRLNLRNIDIYSEATLPIALLLIYSFSRFGLSENSKWIFTRFATTKLLTYSDGPFLFLLYFLIRPKKIIENQQRYENIPDLIEDNVFYQDGGDVLKRTDYAIYISKIISNKVTNSAFAICIKGDWGSGKTVFLNQVEKYVSNSIIIRFNPWLSKDFDSIVPDFFRLLIERTSDYDKYLSSVFQRYSENLLNLDEAFSKKIFSSLGLIPNEKRNSLELQSIEIKERLSSQQLKIVTFIDDLDRLNGNEILAILKLIRNSFDFPNTFFVVAYDENYVRNELVKLITNPETFLEKIFQLEIDLPSHPNDLIEFQLLKILSENKSDFQKNQIKQSVLFISSKQIMHEKIKSMRDVIRLANSFNHIYWKKSNEIDTTDFLLLEILKLKSKPTYNIVRNALALGQSNELLTIPSLSEESSDLIIYNDLENYASPGFNLDKKILKCLFAREDNFDTVKSIRYVHNIIRYFSDDLFGNISYSSFEVYRDEEFDRMKELIDSRGEDIDPILNLILLVNRFSNIHELSNITKALLYVSNKFHYYRHIGTIAFNLNKNKQSIESATNGHGGFNGYVKSLMVKDTHDALAESKVLGQFLDFENHNSEAWLSLFDKQDLIDWLLANLHSFIDRHGDHFDYNVYEIYYAIIAEINNNLIIMSNEANELLKKYIISNQKTYFTKWLIRKKYSGNIHQDIFVLEPFIEQYLGWGLFEELLFGQTNSTEATYLQSFYRNYKSNNFTEGKIEEGLINIHSDKYTFFVKSPDYPELIPGHSIETDRKKAYSLKFEIFKYSSWITQRIRLSIKEAVDGGLYIFRREFTLVMPKEGFKSATLFCLVDDSLELNINGKVIERTVIGFEELHSFNIIEYLIDGPNEVVFYVGNVRMTDELIKEDPDNNPFDFIYTIEIKS